MIFATLANIWRMLVLKRKERVFKTHNKTQILRIVSSHPVGSDVENKCDASKTITEMTYIVVPY